MSYSGFFKGSFRRFRAVSGMRAPSFDKYKFPVRFLLDQPTTSTFCFCPSERKVNGQSAPLSSSTIARRGAPSLLPRTIRFLLCSARGSRLCLSCPPSFCTMFCEKILYIRSSITRCLLLVVPLNKDRPSGMMSSPCLCAHCCYSLSLK